VVTYALIWEASLLTVGYTDFVAQWGLVPRRFAADPIGQLPNILSSMFMHDPSSWWHLGGNMLYLWIFGDNVEDALGRWRFLTFYLLCGVGAALVQVFINANSVIPMVGASGAIAGVLAAYGSLHPRSPVMVLNPIPLFWLFWPFLYLPAWLVILVFFMLNLVNGLATLGVDSGGVAFFAHLGGFLTGLLLIRVMLKDAPSTSSTPEVYPPTPRVVAWGASRRRR
jgi:membrane associated rhomboid family serine protease